MYVVVPCKFGIDPIENNRDNSWTFSPYNVYGSYLLPWKPEFLSNLAQNQMQPFPHPNDASDKI